MNAKLEMVARYLLALALLVFGADKFLHFMPHPEPPEAGGQYLGALFGAGFIFPTIGVVFIVAALCLLTKRVVLALLLVSPVILNILLYHATYDVPGIGAGAVLAVLALALFCFHARGVAMLFQPNEMK